MQLHSPSNTIGPIVSGTFDGFCALQPQAINLRAAAGKRPISEYLQDVEMQVKQELSTVIVMEQVLNTVIDYVNTSAKGPIYDPEAMIQTQIDQLEITARNFISSINTSQRNLKKYRKDYSSQVHVLEELYDELIIQYHSIVETFKYFQWEVLIYDGHNSRSGEEYTSGKELRESILGRN